MKFFVLIANAGIASFLAFLVFLMFVCIGLYLTYSTFLDIKAILKNPKIPIFSAQAIRNIDVSTLPRILIIENVIIPNIVEFTSETDNSKHSIELKDYKFNTLIADNETIYTTNFPFNMFIQLTDKDKKRILYDVPITLTVRNGDLSISADDWKFYFSLGYKLSEKQFKMSEKQNSFELYEKTNLFLKILKGLIQLFLSIYVLLFAIDKLGVFGKIFNSEY